LRVSSRREDEAPVALKGFHPVGNTARVFGAWVWCECKIGTDEGGAELRHQLLKRIGWIAPSLLTGRLVEARRVTRPMNEFVNERSVVGLRVKEALERWHKHVIPARNVAGVIANVLYHNAGAGDERLDIGGALGQVEGG
jgi:hypothetical protein